MKNHTLTIVHVAIFTGQQPHHFTFLTTDLARLQAQLEQECRTSLIPLHYEMCGDTPVVVRYKKDPEFHKVLTGLLATTFYLRCEEFLPLEDTIHTPSVRTSLLLAHSMYVPHTDFECFLGQHHLLRAYYDKKITFTVQSERTEHSSECGERHFNHRYETTELTQEELLHGVTTEKNSRVYTSTTYTKVACVTGVNDRGESVVIMV